MCAHRRFSKPPRWAQAGSLGGHVYVERRGSCRRPLAASAPVRVVTILPSLAVSKATLATQPLVWAAFLWSCARCKAAGAVAPSSNHPWRNLLAFQLTGFFIHRRLWAGPSCPGQIVHKFELFKFELTSFHCIIMNQDQIINKKGGLVFVIWERVTQAYQLWIPSPSGNIGQRRINVRPASA